MLFFAIMITIFYILPGLLSWLAIRRLWITEHRQPELFDVVFVLLPFANVALVLVNGLPFGSPGTNIVPVIANFFFCINEKK